jgi:hypothetical protein
MLKLFAVKVWRTSEPRNFETFGFARPLARRAQGLAIESYPGCDAHALSVFVDGTWHCAAHDE